MRKVPNKINIEEIRNGFLPWKSPISEPIRSMTIIILSVIIKLLLSIKSYFLTLFLLNRWSKSQRETQVSFRSLLSVLSRKLRISTIKLSSCFTRGAVCGFHTLENYKQRMINSSFLPLAGFCQSHQSIKSFNLMASNGGLKVRQPLPSVQENPFNRAETFASVLLKRFEYLFSVGKHLLTIRSILFTQNKSSNFIPLLST